jgi:hypothetical protein
VDEVVERRLDPYQHANRSMRIPHNELSLKAAAEYFGVPKISSIANGLKAGFLCVQYRSCLDPAERERHESDLTAYNCDDLEATAAVVKIMRDGPEHWPAARANCWEEQREKKALPPRLRPGPRKSREERVAERRARREATEATAPPQDSPQNPRGA